MSKKHTLTLAREAYAWDLRCQGYTTTRIAKEMAKVPHLMNGKESISQVAVTKMLKRVELKVLEKLEQSVESIKSRHTAVLERNMEKLIDAYEASTKAQVFQEQTTGGAGKTGAVQRSKVGQKTQVGDHNIIKEIREHMADVRKIWGVDAPAKSDITFNGETVLTPSDLSSLSDDELHQLQSLHKKINAGKQASGASA